MTITEEKKSLTEREFLNAIQEMEIEDIYKEYAKNALAKLDAQLAKRKEKPTKAQVENAPLLRQMEEILVASDEPLTASELAERMKINVQKASSLARQLAGQGVVESQEAKVKGKGKVKIYTIAVGD